MRAVDFDDIEPGNKILRQIEKGKLMLFEVEKINHIERSVMCKDNYMDFYPNEDDQFIVMD
jgi:hypothetical protein